MQQNNIFTIAKRNVEGQDMLYQSIKLTNNVWVLTEIKIPPGGSVYTVRRLFPISSLNPTFNFKVMMYYDSWLAFYFQLSVKSVTVDVAPGVYQAYENILRT